MMLHQMFWFISSHEPRANAPSHFDYAHDDAVAAATATAAAAAAVALFR